MDLDILRLTENIITQAFEEQNALLLQKEKTFLLYSYAMVMAETYPQIEYIKPTNVQLRVDPDFMYEENYVLSLKKMLTYIERILQQQLDLIEAKLLFDSWFYGSTDAGSLQYVYHESELVNISEAADYLSVSRTTIYKNIDRGLETVGEKYNQKIPRFMLGAWKKPEVAFQLQWVAQLKRAREQTIDQP